MTGVNVVQRNYNTQEKNNLWDKFGREEFNNMFNSVQFNANSTKDFNNVDDVISGKNVKIKLLNQQHRSLDDYHNVDPTLNNTANPIKRIVYDMYDETQLQMDDDQ